MSKDIPLFGKIWTFKLFALLFRHKIYSGLTCVPLIKINQLPMQIIYSSIIVLILTTFNIANGSDEQNSLPMREKGASTFYIDGHIQGYGSTEFMVDTGSGYTTINENTLKILKENGNATYLKKLKGILADGTEKIVPVYRLSKLKLGSSCELYNIEAAVFPGKTRHILGLSTLKKTGTFTFSFKPPALQLSSCTQTQT